MSGLCRTIGIPARIILFQFAEDGIEHAFAEIYVGPDYDGGDYDGWIPADADWSQTNGGFFGWDEFHSRIWDDTNWRWHYNHPKLEDGYKVTDIYWIYYAAGTSTNPYTSEWYENNANGYWRDYTLTWDTRADFVNKLMYA